VKISRNWLQSYVNLEGRSNDEISRAITFLGFEVESIHLTGAPKLDAVFVGEVLTRNRHPNADKLSVCTVDVGPVHGVKTIVCGAQNYRVGDRVPVALAGAVLPGNFTIKQSKIRGEMSDGMMCSGKELGIGEDHSGLLILDHRPALGLPINEVLPPGDAVFDIEITPNRPDCLSHLGIARELAAWFRVPLNYPEVMIERTAPSRDADRHDLLRHVRVEAPDDCPLYLARVIAGVKIGPSPAWLQERLSSVGLRPINNVVDVGNFVMLEYGQPLHAFDARKLSGPEIVVRRAVEGESIVTLDGKTRALSSQTLVIADAVKPVVVAGVMGGENSGVDASTTDLVLEAAYFRRQSIRATSKRMALSSDSSYRYERGVDPHALPEAARRAVNLILQTAGGQLVGPQFSVGGDVPWQREILLSPDFVNERLGFAVPAADMKAALESLELTVAREEEGASGVVWTVEIPSWRDDLDRPIDLVEEILRLHGTERIPASPVIAPGLPENDDPVVDYNRRALAYLVGHDFHECVNYTLRSAREAAVTVDSSTVEKLALSNPFVEDQSHLRASLIGGLLESLRLNQSRGLSVTRLAESGRVFLEREGRLLECVAVAFLMAESVSERSWLNREPADFFGAKHHAHSLAALAGLDLARFTRPVVGGECRQWQEGHAGVAGDLGQGWRASFGLLSVAAVKSLGVSGRVYAGEVILLPEKVGAERTHRRYKPFGLFPAALRDLAVVVDESLPSEEARRALVKAARAVIGPAFAIERVAVFDVYRGEGLPPGKKSLAFSLVFRAEDRTLTDEEVNRVFQALQESLIAATGYGIRK
jgi:phenylalanyl-tRNA synthetase beta chain